MCEDENCEWTDVLELVVSSMNPTGNSATGPSPHYIIIGRQPDISLLKLPYDEAANLSTAAYGIILTPY